MKKIPTAREFFNEFCNKRTNTGALNDTERLDIMIDFAKLHVGAALEQVRYNVEINDFDEHGQYSPCVDEPSILNAYPLDNIK